MLRTFGTSVELSGAAWLASPVMAVGTTGALGVSARGGRLASGRPLRVPRPKADSRAGGAGRVLTVAALSPSPRVEASWPSSSLWLAVVTPVASGGLRPANVGNAKPRGNAPVLKGATV